MTSISSIRQRILEQAMRGKLVPQDKNDEPASVLLKKIQKEKEKMRKEGKLKKQKPLPPIEEKEIPYELPEGWMWVRLGEIGQIVGGGTPKTDIDEYWAEPGQGIPWLTPADLSGHTEMYISRGKRDISHLGLEKSSATLMPKGTVLFSSRAPIGYVAIAENEISTNQGFKSIVPYLMETNMYIYYFLKHIGKEINEKATGTTFKEISGKQLSLQVIPLPPLKEQKRIVEKINELFSLCDQWEKEVEFQQKHIQTLREKVLADAIRGLLVEQNEDDEPTSVLLKRMKEEKKRWMKEGKIGKQKTFAPINSDEVPFEIPTTWEWVRLGEIAMINPRNKLDEDIDVGFMPMSLLEEGYSGKHSYEIRKWGEVKKGYTHFQERDIVVAKITPCFENKKSAIMRNLPNGYGAGTTELHVIRPFSGYVLAEYLMLIFKSDWFVEAGVSNFTGTAGQQRIPKDFIENYPIPLPPYEEQKRIVKKVEIIMETIEVMEKNIVPIK